MTDPVAVTGTNAWEDDRDGSITIALHVDMVGEASEFRLERRQAILLADHLRILTKTRD